MFKGGKKYTEQQQTTGTKDTSEHNKKYFNKITSIAPPTTNALDEQAYLNTNASNEKPQLEQKPTKSTRNNWCFEMIP